MRAKGARELRGFFECSLSGKRIFLLITLIALLVVHSELKIGRERWEREYARKLTEEEAFVQALLEEARKGGDEEELSSRANEKFPGTERVRYEELFDGLFLVTDTGFMRLDGFLAVEQPISKSPYREIKLEVADAGVQIFIYRMTWGWD